MEEEEEEETGGGGSSVLVHCHTTGGWLSVFTHVCMCAFLVMYGLCAFMCTFKTLIFPQSRDVFPIEFTT